MKATTRTSNGPFQIVIEGAGAHQVNGVYHHDGYFANACKYSKQGKWDWANYTFVILRGNVSNNNNNNNNDTVTRRRWYISIVPDGESPGTSSAIDFYSAPAMTCEHFPPSEGWVKEKEGREPPPKVSRRYKAGRIVFSKNELLQFRGLPNCLQRPRTLPNMIIVKGPSRKSMQLKASPGTARGSSSGTGAGGREQKGKRATRRGPRKPATMSDEYRCEEKVKSLLNDMTKENFEKSTRQLVKISMESDEKLIMVIDNIHNKATRDEKPALYAELCVELCQSSSAEQVNQAAGSKTKGFRRLLLNKLQTDFDEITTNPKRQEDLASRDTGTDTTNQKVGNMLFIGELYKRKLVNEKIMRYCLSSLLQLDDSDGSPGFDELKYSCNLTEDDHEAICALLLTIGSEIDSRPALGDFVTVCFAKISKFSNDETLPKRVRLMYYDLLELRRNQWVGDDNMHWNDDEVGTGDIHEGGAGADWQSSDDNDDNANDAKDSCAQDLSALLLKSRIAASEHLSQELLSNEKETAYVQQTDSVDEYEYELLRTEIASLRAIIDDKERQEEHEQLKSTYRRLLEQVALHEEKDPEQLKAHIAALEAKVTRYERQEKDLHAQEEQQNKARILQEMQRRLDAEASRQHQHQQQQQQQQQQNMPGGLFPGPTIDDDSEIDRWP